MSPRIHNRLPRPLRRTNYTLTAILVLTGAAWLALAYLAAPAGEPTPAPHPWNGPLLAIHGVAAYAAMLAYALVGHAHLRAGWRQPTLRPVAAVLVVAILLLAVTGLALYYAAADLTRAWAQWTHIAAGVAMPVALALHIRNGRRVARRHDSRAARLR
ncbi:MAG: hypothetical protein U1F41_09785 [Burkholderiales bacterium]